MPDVRKTVRFFDAVLSEADGTRGYVDSDFWTNLIDTAVTWTPEAREFPINGVKYFGIPRNPVRPALPHLQVGRVRDLSEQLQRYNLATGGVAALEFEDPNDRVSEPTYVVPFGHDGRVAIMSPAVRATRHETLARWVTGVCDMERQGTSIELVPVVDQAVIEKIMSAEGAFMLDVHVRAGEHVPESGGGDIGAGFRSARRHGTEELDLQMRWSLGRRTGSGAVRDLLRDAALWVANGGFSHKAEVSIETTNEAGELKRELHSIFDDRIASQVSFFVREGEQASEEEVLTAIAEAIRRFMAGTPTGSDA